VGLQMALEPVPVKCRIPEILREKRSEPHQVYEDINMSKHQFSDYSNMRKIPNLKNAVLIANYLQVPVEELHVWKWVERKRGRQ